MIELPKTDAIKDSLSIEEKYYEPTSLAIIDAQVLLENSPSAMDNFIYDYKFRLTKSSHTAKGSILFEYADDTSSVPFIGVDKFLTEKDFDKPTYFDVYKIDCGKEWNEYCFDVAEDDTPVGHVLIKSGWFIVVDADNEEVKNLLNKVNKNDYTIIPDFIGTVQASYSICELGSPDEACCSGLDFYCADYSTYTVFDSAAYYDL